ncbi:Hint domain-containing protein, partial [Acetobacter pasteurianus]|uniref:Hint domain-containing protein n=1 Tax=Acetobacter pasteurianus TaxID=438 RepID=UPI0020301621
MPTTVTHGTTYFSGTNTSKINVSTGRVAVINSDASVAYTGLGNVVDGTTSGSVTNYGSISASTADIDVSTNGTFYNYGTVSSVDDVRANTSGVIVLGTSSVLKATGYFDVSTNGSLTVDKNATLSVAGTFNNSTYGIVTINGGTVSTSGRLDNSTTGNITINSGGALTAGSIDNATSGTISLSSGTLNTSGNINNSTSGTITGSNGSNITINGTVHNSTNGLISVDKSTASITAITGKTGTVSVANSSSVSIGSMAGTIAFSGNSNVVTLGTAQSLTSLPTVTGFNGTDKIDLDGVTFTGTPSISYNNGTLTIVDDTQTITWKNFSLASGYDSSTLKLEKEADGSLAVVCFLPGSMIRTTVGEVAVEDVQIGDEVLAFDWRNNTDIVRPVVWVGKAHVKVQHGLPDDEAGWPVRILKDAIADGIPYKDMLITAEHCLFFRDRFVPVRMLVNGVSIFYDKSITSYDYYHVETEQHSVITADGMLTESYLDTGNRSSFRQEGKIATLRGAVKNWADDAGAPLGVERSFVEPLFRALQWRENSVVGTKISTRKSHRRV